VKLTPPGSSCSIQIGIGLAPEPAGAVREQLDLAGARVSGGLTSQVAQERLEQ
jgi:hypothetical protein